MAALATAAKLRSEVFPPKPPAPFARQKRQSGSLKKEKQITFRPPPELRGFIEGAEAGGYTKTSVVLRCIAIAKDAMEALGDEWWEIERQAHVEGVGPGTILGRLALEALQRKAKK